MAFGIGLIDRMKFGQTTYLHVRHPVFDLIAPIRLRFGISCSSRLGVHGPHLSTPSSTSKIYVFLGRLFHGRPSVEIFSMSKTISNPPFLTHVSEARKDVVPSDPRLLNTMADQADWPKRI
jgi:hypothetical protein